MKKAKSPLMEMVGRNKIGRGVFVYQKKRYTYLILSKDFEPNLPGFLGYPEQKDLIISEEVPKAFRKFMLIHEIIEFTDLAGRQDRCVNALKIELKLVPKKIWREYMEYRKNFFNVLIEYSQKYPDEEFKHEIKKATSICVRFPKIDTRQRLKGVTEKSRLNFAQNSLAPLECGRLDLAPG